MRSGETKLTELVATRENMPAEGFVTALLDDLRRWSGHNTDSRRFSDDLTVVVVDYDKH